MQGNEGIRLGWVLCIEGCEYLLTDHPAPTTTLIGWNTTSWSSVLPGLIVEGDWEQKIHPYKRDLDITDLTFRIVPDSDDTFGTLVHKVAGGDQTELTATIDAADSPIPCSSTSAFASSGTIYIGTERITYTGTAATQFQGTVNRGTLHPFSVDGGTANQFGRDHTIPTYDFDTSYKPKISEQPRVWIGKHVALFAHRITGAQTWDTKAQAQLMFAGTITAIEDTASGHTLIHCEDIRGRIGKTVMLSDQYKARPPEGIYVKTGWAFTATDQFTSGGAVWTSGSTTLTVVSGAPADAYEIQAGYYTAAELVSAFSEWLALAVQDVELNLFWVCKLATETDGSTRFQLNGHTPSSTNLTIRLKGPAHAMFSIGFDVGTSTGYVTKSATAGSGAEPGAILRAELPPVKSRLVVDDEATMTLGAETGTWFSQLDWLPDDMNEGVTSGDVGVLSDGNWYWVVDRQSALTFTVLGTYGPGFLPLADSDYGVAYGFTREGEPDVVLRQVAILEGKFSDLFLRFLASTGSAGYNSATYDAFPACLGAAIPWEILGDPMEQTALALDADTSPTLTIVIDKPTRLWDLLSAEFIIRGAYLVWKGDSDGTGLRITRWQTPASVSNYHTFTEANKASSDPNDTQRTVTQTTGAFMSNVWKIEYGRELFGETYLYTDEFRAIASISDHGEASPITVSLRNYLSGRSEDLDAIRDLIADAVATLLPMFARPLRMMRRTIAFNHYGPTVAPGDHCVVTDSFARNPATGLRSISARVGLIVAHRYMWPHNGGELMGEVDVIFPDFDSVPVYSPSAQIDNGAANAGYAADTPSAGKSTITFEAHEFSKSSAAVDISHFAANDLVYIYEVDDTAAATSWTATIESVNAGANTCVLNTNLAAFDTTGATIYRVEARLYTDAAAQQKTKAFSADDGDQLVQDAREPYTWGQVFSGGVFTAATGTQLPDLPSTTGGGLIFGRSDGSPVTPALHRMLIRFINNYIDYKSAVQHPIMYGNAVGAPLGGATGADWELTWLMPYYFGPGGTNTFTRRTMGIAPMFASSGAGNTVSVRVTLSMYPPGGDSLTNVAFFGPRVQFTWTSSSTTQAIKTVEDMAQIGRKQHGHGYGWLSVETSGSGGHGSSANFWGLGEVSQNARGL